MPPLRRRAERNRPSLHYPTPDPGRVHPYGNHLASRPDDQPDPDAKVWTCTHCGYQWERRSEPPQCPNCAMENTFTRT